MQVLKTKRAIIHGGAGALGRAIARAYVDAGARVFLTGRTLERVRAVAAELGDPAEAARVDARDADAVRAHADAVARGGGIDIVVNAIGIDHVQGVGLAELSVDDYMLPIETYTRAGFVIAQAAARHMTDGVILMLSPPGGRLVGRGWLGHGVAFAGVEMLSRLLAAELGPRGVRVACICPDAIPEAFAPGSGARPMFERIAAAAGTTVEAMLAERARTAPVTGRLPTLADVAHAAVFLASPHARAITCTVLNLTAGARYD